MSLSTSALPKLADITARAESWLVSPSTSASDGRPTRRHSFSDVSTPLRVTRSRTLEKNHSNGQLPRLIAPTTAASKLGRSLELPDWKKTTTMKSLDLREQDDYLGCNCLSCQDIKRYNRSVRTRHDLIEKVPDMPFKVGDRVVLSEERTGIVRWIGRFHSDVLNRPAFVGLQLDDPIGETDGMQGGKRYFSCPEKHGIFVAVSDIALVKDRHRLNYRVVNAQALNKIKKPGKPVVSETPRLSPKPVVTTPTSRKRTPRKSTARKPQLKPRFATARLEKPLQLTWREPPSTPHANTEAISPAAAHRKQATQRLMEAYRLGEKLLRDQEDGGLSRLERLAQPKHAPAPVEPTVEPKPKLIQKAEPEEPKELGTSLPAVPPAAEKVVAALAPPANNIDSNMIRRKTVVIVSPQTQRRASAVKIQAVFRGHRARKQYRQTKATSRAAEVAPALSAKHQLVEDQLQASAIKIQAAFRGHRARKSMAIRRQSKAAEATQHLNPVEAPAVEETQAVLQDGQPTSDSVDYEAVILDAFVRVDISEQGYLETEELEMFLTSSVLNLAIDERQLPAIMSRIPVAPNGQIDYKKDVVPDLRELVRSTLPPDTANEDSWVEIYSQLQEVVFYLQRTSGLVTANLPDTATTYYPSPYQPSQDDFDRMGLTTFLAADRLGRGYVTAEEFVGLMRAPELNFRLSEEEEQYYYELSKVATNGYIDFEAFRVTMKQMCARVYLSHAPQGADWVAVDSPEFGAMFYHRVTGESQRETPAEPFVHLEQT